MEKETEHLASESSTTHSETSSQPMIQTDSFDPSLNPTFNLSSIIFTNNNKTATAPLESGHVGLLGSCVISNGKKTWKVRIDQYSASQWLFIGIIGRPIYDFEYSYSQPASFGLAKSYKYIAGACGVTSAADDWAVGHVIQVDLDCDSGKLTITNLNTGKFEEWQNVPSNNYHLHVNLYNIYDSVTILDQ